MGWMDRDTGGLVFRRENAVSNMEVACGQCLGCRLDYSRMWAMRIVHESSLYERNCFITLTYDDACIPDDWSLCLEHFQLFMKRLRKRFSSRIIRFYHCGEYGGRCKHGVKLELVKCPLCNVGRPHYHACLFNIDFDDLVCYGYSDATGEELYTSPLLESIWTLGFVDVGELNFASAAYVARYILKRVSGVLADDHYMQCDYDGVATWVKPEYVTMSRRPGIGRDWFLKFRSDVFPSDECPVPGVGVIKKVPRYYEEIFKCEDPLSLADIKSVRRSFLAAHAAEYTPERLMDKYKVKKAQVSMLSRSV